MLKIKGLCQDKVLHNLGKFKQGLIFENCIIGASKNMQLNAGGGNNAQFLYFVIL